MGPTETPRRPGRNGVEGEGRRGPFSLSHTPTHLPAPPRTYLSVAERYTGPTAPSDLPLPDALHTGTGTPDTSHSTSRSTVSHALLRSGVH